ncbi:MAG: hypothetical protein IJO56_00285 [Oscillospiraceae bacterium]|nr:hypothetical protein [Oscillospiraceae bacterium]
MAKKENGAMKTVKSVFSSIGNVFKVGASWVSRLHKLIYAVPVVVGAVLLAQESMDRLPDPVGIGLLADGTYSQLISKELAVMGPLALTAVCLLLMFCSKRTLYPWLISLFSLVLPLMILLTNIFPT